VFDRRRSKRKEVGRSKASIGIGAAIVVASQNLSQNDGSRTDQSINRRPRAGREMDKCHGKDQETR
jgi:hypothetical protein